METIKSSSDISELFEKGTWIKTPFLTVIASERQTSPHREDSLQHDLPGRVAFIAGKKLGNAVWRNKAKRRLRALCHDLGGPWPRYDVIFLAKSSLTKAPYSKVLRTCDRTLRHSFKDGKGIEGA